MQAVGQRVIDRVDRRIGEQRVVRRMHMREGLAQLPGVQAIESNIVMSAIKDTTALPLELAEPPMPVFSHTQKWDQS